MKYINISLTTCAIHLRVMSPARWHHKKKYRVYLQTSSVCYSYPNKEKFTQACFRRREISEFRWGFRLNNKYM